MYELTSSVHRSSGVATIIRSSMPGLLSAEVEETRRIPGRYLVVKLEFDDGMVFVHNVYVPVRPPEQPAFFTQLLEQEEFDPSASHIICGDFNVAIDPRLDSKRGNRRDPSVSQLQLWLLRLKVVDAFRIHNPERRVFSGPEVSSNNDQQASSYPRPRVTRLDYIFLSNVLIDEAYFQSKYFPARDGGDHLAHSVELRSSRLPRGKGIWRLPFELLELPVVRETIRHEANLLLERLRNCVDPGKEWSQWKRHTKKQLQAIHAKLATQDKLVTKRAEIELRTALLLYNAQQTPENAARAEAAATAYKSVQDMVKKRREDSSFDTYISESDEGTSFFYRPVEPLRRVPLRSVFLPGGGESSTREGIDEGFRRFWGEVFADERYTDSIPPSRPDQTSRTLLGAIEHKLDAEQQQQIDRAIKPAEFTSALKRMRGTSAPGMDGLPAAFYQCAPEVFGEIFAIVFPHLLESGYLAPSHRNSCVCFLYKKGDRRHPGNYRPIALMNVDIKILTKTLATRVRSVLPKLVSPEQQGFVPGRSLQYQYRFMDDLKSLVQRDRRPGYALFLDFEKAYDRVDWTYLRQVLSTMGFGPRFLSWISVLYKDPMYYFILDGHVSGPVKPTRGVKQGDPLSPLLFILSLEPLVALLRANKSLGLDCGGSEVPGIFFADDSTLLSSSQSNLERLLDIVQVYCSASGARLNSQKCSLVALNAAFPPRTTPRYTCLRQGETYKFLGFPFGTETSSHNALVGQISDRVFSRIKHWAYRARTLRGRLLLTHSMVLSCIWFYAAQVEFPKSLIKLWQSAVNKFVLSRRTNRDDRPLQLIGSGYLYKPRSEGGLQFPHVSTTISAIRISFLQQFCQESMKPHPPHWILPAHSLWRHLVPRLGKCHPLDFLSFSPTRYKSLMTATALPMWWKRVWDLWSRTVWPITNTGNVREHGRDPFQAPLWLNRDPIYQVGPQHNRIPLVAVAEPHRSFRLEFARRTGLRTLGDVCSQGSWPHFGAFYQRFQTGNRSQPTNRQELKMWMDLHSDLTAIYNRVHPTRRHDPGNWETYVPVAGCEGSRGPVWFPRLGKKLIRSLFQTGAITTPHPLRIHNGGLTDADIHRHLDQVHRRRRLVLPVYHDVWFRLLFRLLPARTRLSFSDRPDPNSVCCTYPSCSAAETYTHLFLECRPAREVWRQIWHDWRPLLGGHLTWTTLIFSWYPSEGSPWYERRLAVADLWHVMRLVVTRTLWVNRNKFHFEEVEHPSTTSAIATILGTVSAHVRSLKRRAPRETLEAYDQVLSFLLTRPTFGEFFRDRLHLLQASTFSLQPTR